MEEDGWRRTDGGGRLALVGEPSTSRPLPHRTPPALPQVAPVGVTWRSPAPAGPLPCPQKGTRLRPVRDAPLWPFGASADAEKCRRSRDIPIHDEKGSSTPRPSYMTNRGVQRPDYLT